MAAPEVVAPEVWYLRGEGGDIIAMELPLGEGIPGRLRSGAIARVNADGTQWTGDVVSESPASLSEKRAADELAQQAEELVNPVPRPAQADKKAAWVAHAASTGTITVAAAEDLTKDELIARYGG